MMDNVNSSYSYDWSDYSSKDMYGWDEVIEMYSYSLVDKIVIVIFMPIVVIFGIIGNIMTIVVIVRNQRMHTSVNVYFANLAIADTLFLALAPDLFWTSIVDSPLRFEYNIGVENTWICTFYLYVVDTVFQVAIFIIFAMSIDRYKAICYPIKFRINNSGSVSRTIKTCCLVWCITFAWQSRKLVWVEIFTRSFPWPDMYNGVPNSTTTCAYCVDELDCKINEYLYVFDTCLSLTLILVVASLYRTMLITLKTSPFMAINSVNKSRSKSEKTVFLTVFLTVTVFIVCTAPFGIFNFISIFGNVNYKNTVNPANILRLALLINSSVNPIIYNAVNDRFRKAFLNTFCCNNYCKYTKHTLTNDHVVTPVFLVAYLKTHN
ncbi:kappa-type opioid receptor-like [Antedon mediterranea]|uniref:kappa-type opioid receptor-like n=1 Tax=Antedon mediterranea TaxID=105859 RepID=UPI003AF985D3